MERIAGERLLAMGPEQLRASYAPLIMEEDPFMTQIIEAADKLSAYAKCIDEQKAGNAEFNSAAVQTMQAMKDMDLPELNWFIEECLPAFALNLDQL